MAENFSRARVCLGRTLPLFPSPPSRPALLRPSRHHCCRAHHRHGQPLGRQSRTHDVQQHARAFAAGGFDVDPGAIGWEGFLRDGKTYSYFGVFAAFLRLPLILFGGLATIDVIALSCLVAVVALAASQLAAIVMIWRILPPSAFNRLLAGAPAKKPPQR